MDPVHLMLPVRREPERGPLRDAGVPCGHNGRLHAQPHQNSQIWSKEN